jgi:SagB-type dehydrogenase family enzyme
MATSISCLTLRTLQTRCHALALEDLRQKGEIVGMEAIEKYRQFLRNDDWEKWEILGRDQKQGVPPPNMQKAYPPGAPLIDLIPPEAFSVGDVPLIEAISRRRSHRDFSGESLTMEELAFLLWATQGVQEVSIDGTESLRTVPSAGARHPFETYLIVRRVGGLQPGLYRYLALEHKLCLLSPLDETAAPEIYDDWQLEPEDALLFIWTIIPYRTEWRYSILSHKMIAMEAGHICQNLYLAATAIGAGVCAIGAFPQAEIDKLISVDGADEFAVYLARLGKI